MKSIFKSKKEVKLKPNLFDLAILLFSLIIVSILLLVVNINSYNSSKYQGDRIANVYVNGQKIKEVNLSSLSSDYELVLLEENYPSVKERIVISFSKEKGVAVTEAHCKDLICKGQGYIYLSSRSIVCLPSGVVITISDGQSGNEGWM